MRNDLDLFAAIAAGDLKRTARLVEEVPHRLFSRDPNGQSPVVSALGLGNREIARYLGEQVLAAIRKGVVREEDLYSALHALGEAKITEAEADVIRFLEHQDPEIRFIVASVLAYHWDRKSSLDHLERLLTSDPSEDVRAVAARGIGYLMRGTRDPRTSALLLTRFKDLDETQYVRKAAYDGLRSIWLTPKARDQEELEEIRNVAKRTLDRSAELEESPPQSREEFEAEQILGNMEWQSKVDWGFVEMVERQIAK